MYEEEYKEGLEIGEPYTYKSREKLLNEFLRLLNAKFQDRTVADLSLKDSEKKPEKEVELLKNDIASKINEISSNIAELNSKFNALISLSKEMLFVLEKILKALSEKKYDDSAEKEEYIVHIKNYVGKKRLEELPKFDSLEKRIKYIHDKIKEIGPISKRSAIEE